jgi:hypothetical protein
MEGGALMPEYRVEWCVEVEANDRQEAARLALAIQQSGDRLLSAVFNVWGTEPRGAHRSRPIAGDLTCPRPR